MHGVNHIKWNDFASIQSIYTCIEKIILTGHNKHYSVLTTSVRVKIYDQVSYG